MGQSSTPLLYACSKLLVIYYHQQQSWGKVIFSQASVILLTGGVCLSACWDTATPEQAPPRADNPLEQTPQDQAPLPGADTPRRRACWETRSTRGRYGSYWNAILYFLIHVPKYISKCSHESMESYILKNSTVIKSHIM